MLIPYIRAAMRHATYEILPEDKTFYGEIPPCRGVWACEATLEECRDELESVLQSWMLVRFASGLSLPIVDDIDLSVDLSTPIEDELAVEMEVEQAA